MKAVVLGAGRIGCGLVTESLLASGHEVVIAARGVVLRHLRTSGCFTVRLVQRGSVESRVVTGFDVVDVVDRDRVTAELAEGDLIATAVGAGNLASVAPLIGAGLARSERPVNILAFENHASAGPVLREFVAASMDGAPDRIVDVGFSGVVIGQVMAHRVLDADPRTPITFIGDRPDELYVDANALHQPLEFVRGVRAVPDYDAWMQRKLFTYSAGHAATAYLGQLKGYHYIHAAIRDPEIRAAVLAAMTEGQRGLAVRYGPHVAGTAADLEAIINRFENAALNDPISRVGRDPRRKLGTHDRLAGAARLAASAGLDPRGLTTAMAAALCFCDGNDPDAARFHAELQRQGAEAVLAAVSGVPASSPLGRSVVARWRTLSAGWSAGNLLLSLERPAWAWAEHTVVAA